MAVMHKVMISRARCISAGSLQISAQQISEVSTQSVLHSPHYGRTGAGIGSAQSGPNMPAAPALVPLSARGRNQLAALLLN
jgi:hypothetical protein